MSSKLRVCVVGYGYWGPNLVRNFAALEDCEVSSVCDISWRRRAHLEENFAGVPAFTDWREAVRSPGVDAVAVATPVSTHFEIAREVILQGKHVLVEKPLASSAAQALELVDLARRRARVLMVGHTFVYHGAVRKIREMYRGGLLGEALYLDSTRANLGILQDDSNVLWDLAPHDLSILDYILGRQPEAISATGACHTGRGLEDIAFVSLHYPGDFVAHLNLNWLSPVRIRLLLLGCSAKMVVYDDNIPSERVRVFDCGLSRNGSEGKRRNDLIRRGSEDVFIPRLDLTEALSSEVRDFCAAIQGCGQPEADGESGLRVVRLIELACQSLARAGAPVENR